MLCFENWNFGVWKLLNLRILKYVNFWSLKLWVLSFVACFWETWAFKFDDWAFEMMKLWQSETWKLWICQVLEIWKIETLELWTLEKKKRGNEETKKWTTTQRRNQEIKKPRNRETENKQNTFLFSMEGIFFC